MKLARSFGILLVLAAHVHAAKFPGYVRGSRDERAKRVIVFVHGVLGDGDSTWRQAGGQSFPELIADDPLFAGDHIWVHNYASPGLARSYDIDELSRDLERRLEHDNVLRNHGQIIFVAHSMGGLVTRAFLLNRKLAPDRIGFLYFYATPTTGSQLANLARYVSRNPQFRDLRPLRTVDPGILGKYESDWLRSDLQRVRSHCAYEVLPTKLLTVVDRPSATHLCNMPLDPLERDHASIVKPRDREDDVYVALKLAYEQMLKTGSGGLEPAWNLTSKDSALVRVCIAGSNGCAPNAWTDHVKVALGDTVGVAICYRNSGSQRARDTRLVLDMPRTPVSHAIIRAALHSSTTYSAFGISHVDVKGLAALVPLGGWHYAGDSTTAASLPDNQQPEDVFSEPGLQLGEVLPGSQYRGCIIIHLKVLPVTLFGLKGTEDLEKRFESIGLSMFGSPNAMQQAASLMMGGPGAIEYDLDGQPRRWSGRIHDLKHEEAAIFYAVFHNDTQQVMRDVRLAIRKIEETPRRIRLAIDFTSGGKVVRTESAIVTLAQDAELAFAGGIHFPLSFEDIRSLTDFDAIQVQEFWGDPDVGGLSLGDVAVDEFRLCLFAYEPETVIARPKGTGLRKRP